MTDLVQEIKDRLMDDMVLASRRVQYYKTHEEQIDTIARVLERMDGVQRIAVTTDDITISIVGSVGLFLGVVEALEGLGDWKFDYDEAVIQSSLQNHNWFSGYLSKEEGEGLAVYLTFTSDHCQRIVTGEQTVPTYEYRCS